MTTENKKILIIDDENELLTVLSRRLNASGYQVFKADNGISGIRAAKNESPDLIILDIMMPDMDGDEVKEILNLIPDTQNIPVLYLSCLVSETDNYAFGHCDRDSICLGKPYDPEVLLNTIEAMI